jgi:hypothetical protein
MRIFPSRLPIGLILGCCLTLAIAPLTYSIWRHSQSTLESFYLGEYAKANFSLSKTLLSNRPITQQYYIVTIDGNYATPDTIRTAKPQQISGRFVSVQSRAFALWLKEVVYNGRTLGELIEVPILVWLFTGLVLVIAGGAIDFRRRLIAREGEQLRGPETMTVRQFNATIKRKERGFAIHTK